MTLGPILGTGYNVITAAGEEVQASTAAGESSIKALAEATKGVSIEVVKSMLLSAAIEASQVKTVTRLGEEKKLSEEQIKAILEYVDKIGVELIKEGYEKINDKQKGIKD